jgi:hypothetical protein
MMSQVDNMLSTRTFWEISIDDFDLIHFVYSSWETLYEIDPEDEWGIGEPIDMYYRSWCSKELAKEMEIKKIAAVVGYLKYNGFDGYEIVDRTLFPLKAYVECFDGEPESTSKQLLAEAEQKGWVRNEKFLGMLQDETCFLGFRVSVEQDKIQIYIVYGFGSSEKRAPYLESPDSLGMPEVLVGMNEYVNSFLLKARV